MSDIEIFPIGTVVAKKSNRPFKSGQRKATIKTHVPNPYTGNDAYMFEEDDSIVSAERCIRVED